MILPASYANGFAPRDGSPLYPELWRGCVFAAAPMLGPTGLTLRDWSGRANNGTLTNGPTWEPHSKNYAVIFDGIDDQIPFTSFQLAAPYSITATVNLSTFNIILGGDATTNYGMYWTGSDVFHRTSSTTSASVSVSGSTNTTYTITITRVGGVMEVFRDGISMGTASGLTGNGAFGLIGCRSDFAFRIAGRVFAMSIHSRKLSSQEIVLLAQRPGIAYELAPRRRSSSAVQFNRRRRLLLGAQS